MYNGNIKHCVHYIIYTLYIYIHFTCYGHIYTFCGTPKYCFVQTHYILPQKQMAPIYEFTKGSGMNYNYIRVYYVYMYVY